MMTNELLRVKGAVSAQGAEGELAVSSEAAGVLDRWFPRLAGRREITRTLMEGLRQKLASGVPLSGAELEYLESRLHRDEAKLIREYAAIHRTEALLLESGGPAVESVPQDDFTEKWLDDVSLVHDEDLREIYCRIMAGRIKAPKACSLRTLRVLRYLDAATAATFAKALPFVFDQDYIVSDNESLAGYGLSYDDMLNLDDAGLIHANSSSIRYTADEEITWCRTLALRLRCAQHHKFDAYCLHPAAKELMRVADYEPHREFFLDFASAAQRKGLTVSWAEAPRYPWDGSDDDLAWVNVGA